MKGSIYEKLTINRVSQQPFHWLKAMKRKELLCDTFRKFTTRWISIRCIQWIFVFISSHTWWCSLIDVLRLACGKRKRCLNSQNKTSENEIQFVKMEYLFFRNGMEKRFDEHINYYQTTLKRIGFWISTAWKWNCLLLRFGNWFRHSMTWEI
jgi:hypothetical protein